MKGEENYLVMILKKKISSNQPKTYKILTRRHDIICQKFLLPGTSERAMQKLQDYLLLEKPISLEIQLNPTENFSLPQPVTAYGGTRQISPSSRLQFEQSP